jgi:tetratricopeptide (TPR) repeat protein
MPLHRTAAMSLEAKDMGYRYPQPDNEHDFETVCLRLYRKVWKNDNLKLYGKRGEKQHGVDICDPFCVAPVRAVQCKFHEPTKNLTPSQIKKEVAKAEKHPTPIEHYIIATTAKKSARAQDTVTALNQRPDKRFAVDIHFWEEICQQASELGEVIAELVIYGKNILAGAGATFEGSGAGITGIWSKPEAGDATGAYAAIEKLLNDRQLDLASHELDKRPSGPAIKELPREQHYQLLRLRAKLAMEKGEFAAAAGLFLEAFGVSPELEQAKHNEVLGLSLLGETDKAYARATCYVAEGIRTPAMILRLVDSIRSRQQLDDHAGVIEPHLASDENINVALFHKYAGFGEYERAQQAAERAVQISPESPHAHLAMAMALHNAAVRGDVRHRTAGLRKAIGHYDQSEKAARDQRFLLLLPEVLSNRAAAKALTRDTSGAAADFREAVSCTSQPAHYAARAVGFFLHEEDYERALELLDDLDRTTNEGHYLALVAEYKNADAEDHSRYIDEMSSLANEDWDRAVECRFYAVKWAIDLKKFDLAASLVTDSFERAHPFQAHVMRAWVCVDKGDTAAAKDETATALAQSIKSAHTQELRLLAHILLALKDDRNALGLLETVAPPGIFDDDTKLLLTCAQRLERHDLLLRLCRELRAAGVVDNHLQELEVKLLNRYSPREALELADEFARKSKSPAYFVAFRNMLAVRLNEPDKVDLNPAKLPTPAKLPPEEANLVLLPWIEMGKYEDALVFLYAQRRIHFENQHAHGRYIFVFLRHSHRTDFRDAPMAVTVGCSVLLELGGGKLRWVTIEDDQPVGSRGEFSSTSAMGEALIGKKAGDTLEMPDRLVQPQIATVRDIQSKYVRGFQDSIENFAKWFPGTSILQPFDVGDVEKPDLTVIVESLKGRREHVDKCLQLYRDQPVPLFLLADCLGVTELETVKALARHPKGIIKCSDASPESFALAVQAGIAPGAIVLSMPAIVTLTLVDGWQHLDAGTDYLVSQMTSEIIDGWIQERADDTLNEGGVLAINEADQLVFIPLTAEDRRTRLDELQRMRRMVDQHCKSASSVGMAALEPGARKTYEQVLGLHNLEAMCVAKDHHAILWTDDAIMGTIAKADFGTTVIWTQLALRCFVESGRLTLDDFELVTAKLAAGNYGSVIWHAGTIIAAGRATAWDADCWPFSQCIRLIEKSTLSIPVRTQIVVETLRLLRRSDCGELRQRPIIRALLGALDDPLAARRILVDLDRIFRIDFLSAHFLRSELESWLRFR